MRFTAILASTVALIAALTLLSLLFGVREIAASDVLGALIAYDPNSIDHVVVREMRVARAITALVGGASLGLAGALMQILTRNPLADPGILGVNAGAALGVVFAIWGLGLAAQVSLVLPALIGAAVAAVLVLLLGGTGSKGGPDPVRLVLAGAALSALFLAFTWVILISSRQSLDVYRFWVLGGFAGIEIADLVALLPLYLIAFPLGFAAAILMEPLVLGDDTARSLGVRLGLVRLVSIAAIVGLCGTTVSLAGPIAFIGLLVPHIVRPFAGVSVRLLSLASAIAGGFLALIADTLGRVIVPGMEIEAGAMMALIGGPALIYLVRFRREVQL